MAPQKAPVLLGKPLTWKRVADKPAMKTDAEHTTWKSGAEQPTWKSVAGPRTASLWPEQIWQSAAGPRTASAWKKEAEQPTWKSAAGPRTASTWKTEPEKPEKPENLPKSTSSVDVEVFAGKWIDSLGNSLTVEVNSGTPVVALMKHTGGPPVMLWLYFDDRLNQWRCGNGSLKDIEYQQNYTDARKASLPLCISWITKDGRVSTWTRASIGSSSSGETISGVSATSAESPALAGKGPCRDGSNCTRPGCWFEHPEPAAISAPNASAEDPQAAVAAPPAAAALSTASAAAALSTASVPEEPPAAVAAPPAAAPQEAAEQPAITMPKPRGDSETQDPATQDKEGSLAALRVRGSWFDVTEEDSDDCICETGVLVLGRDQKAAESKARDQDWVETKNAGSKQWDQGWTETGSKEWDQRWIEEKDAVSAGPKKRNRRRPGRGMHS